MVGDMRIEVQELRHTGTAALSMSNLSGIFKQGHGTEIIYY